MFESDVWSRMFVIGCSDVRSAAKSDVWIRIAECHNLTLLHS